MQRTRNILSSRHGTLAVAALAGVAALIALMTFIHGYKRSLDQSAQPVTVLVAKGELPKGSSGDVMAKSGLFQATGFRRDRVKEGAITDPGSLRGMVAVHDLVPGQQLTTADFAKPSDAVLSRLGPDQRAVTVPLETAHGMVGQIRAGDHVDVFAGFLVQSGGASRPRPVMRVLLQDVEVLAAPKAGKAAGAGLANANQAQNIVLRVSEKEAPQLAFSSDNGKLWISLRPQAGAQQRVPSLVTLDRLLLGKSPIPVDRSLAKKRALVNELYQGGL